MKNIILALTVSLFTVMTVGAQNPLVLCQNQVRAQQYEAALATCEEAAKTNALYGRHGRGMAYMGLMQWGNAITEFSAAIAVNGRAAELFIFRGNAYYYKGDYRSAVGDFERAVMLEPRAAAAVAPMIAQAKAMSDITPVPEKISNTTIRASLTASLEANNLVISRSVMALNKEPQTKIEAVEKQAHAKIDEALKINKYNAHAYSIRGSLYKAQNKLDLAIFEYSKAIAIEPKEINHYKYRAEIYAEGKNYPFALADLAKMTEIDPKSNQAYLDRARIYSDQKKDDLAYAELTKVIELAPKDAFGYGMRASHLMRRGDLERAIADLNTQLTLDPKSDFGMSMRCEYYNKKGNYAAALKDCTGAVAKDGFLTADNAMFERVTTYIGLKKYDLALADVVTLEKRNMIAADELTVKRGLILKAQGKKADAKAAFEAALKSNPKNENAAKELAAMKP